MKSATHIGTVLLFSSLGAIFASSRHEQVPRGRFDDQSESVVRSLHNGNQSRTALILVDVQNDFLPPSGSLAVSEGRDILPNVQKLLSNSRKYDLVVATQDWHPHGHVSFASAHNLPPYTLIQVPIPFSDGQTTPQMLWPDHCVQFSNGSNIEAGVQKTLDQLGDKVNYIKKGTNIAVDAYSGFADNTYFNFTSLSSLFYRHYIQRVVVAGLATDYCVRATSIDARKFGFETVLIKDATRGVNASNTDNVITELEEWGVQISTTEAELSL